jgi:hypothetical protein
MVCTRPSITYVVDIIVQFMSSLSAHHWAIIKKNSDTYKVQELLELNSRGTCKRIKICKT